MAAGRRRGVGLAGRMAVAGLAAIGAQRLYGLAVQRAVRRRALRLEEGVPYDAHTGFCLDRGEPLYLVRHEHDATLFFFNGFRLRSAPGMYAEWLQSMHERLGLNVIAPALGVQSAPYDVRSRGWCFLQDIRTAIQVYDAYAAQAGPGHRLILFSHSYGSIVTLTLAAKRSPSHAILLSPVPHRMGTPMVVRRMQGPVGPLLSRAMDRTLDEEGGLAPGRLSWLPHVLPLYVRRGSSGGWDVADQELRRRANAEIGNVPEVGTADLLELLRAILFARERVLPHLSNRTFTLIYEGRDLVYPPELQHELAERLRSNGNVVDEHHLPDSAHDILLDRDAALAKDIIEGAIANVMGGSETSEGMTPSWLRADGG
ncbi:MAG TPA: alpha/beta fold hydrolase [Dehalococcoidia bacterium]|nr:alpha/beta fold hydrolase [Dehalococcoidia bacterium]